MENEICEKKKKTKISTDPGLPLKIRHSHRFVAVVIQFLIPLTCLSISLFLLTHLLEVEWAEWVELKQN